MPGCFSNNVLAGFYRNLHQENWQWKKASSALILDIKYEGGAWKPPIIKINNILMEYFYKSKLVQKSHDAIHDIKLLNKD